MFEYNLNSFLYKALLDLSPSEVKARNEYLLFSKSIGLIPKILHTLKRCRALTRQVIFRFFEVSPLVIAKVWSMIESVSRENMEHKIYSRLCIS